MPQRLAKAILELSSQPVNGSTPESILADLQCIVEPYDINVFAAGFLPAAALVAPFKIENWRQGKNLFFGDSIAADYWPKNKKAVAELGADAISSKARQSSKPFTFVEAMNEMKSHPGSWIFEFLRDFDIADGLFCPLRLWNVFYASPRLMALSPALRSQLMSAAQVTTGRMETVLKATTLARNIAAVAPNLTAREIEVLQKRAWHDASAIAAELNISRKTVDELLRRARLKLGEPDLLMAVVKAYKYGLIRL